MELKNFFQQLENSIKAGIPPLKALKLLGGILPRGTLKTKSLQMVMLMERGARLSDAMERVGPPFNRLHVSMIKSGEDKGSLAKMFSALALHLEQEKELPKKIWGVFLFPGSIFLVSLLGGYLVLALVGGGGSLNSFFHPMFFTVFPVVGIFGLWFSRRQFRKGNLDKLAIHLPLFGRIFRALAWARFTKTLALCHANGISPNLAIPAAVDACRNKEIQSHLRLLTEKAQTSKKLSDYFMGITGLPATLLETIAVGEEKQNLTELLEKTAQRFEDEVSSQVSSKLNLLALLFFLFVVLYAVYLGVNRGIQLMQSRFAGI